MMRGRMQFPREFLVRISPYEISANPQSDCTATNLEILEANGSLQDEKHINFVSLLWAIGTFWQ
jgi:hypothetical protein